MVRTALQVGSVPSCRSLPTTQHSCVDPTRNVQVGHNPLAFRSPRSPSPVLEFKIIPFISLKKNIYSTYLLKKKTFILTLKFDSNVDKFTLNLERASLDYQLGSHNTSRCKRHCEVLYCFLLHIQPDAKIQGFRKR